MKTILAPFDFSTTSEYALQTAAAIARKANAELIVLHVIEEPITDSFVVDGEYLPEDYENKLFTLMLLKKRTKEFEHLAASAFLEGINTNFKLKIGSAYHGINKIILEHKVDLVVIGGSVHPSKLYFGSITHQIVRHSKCPVLTVHSMAAITDFKNIVFATQTFESEAIFTRMLRSAQLLYDSTIHLVRINTPANFLPDDEAKRLLKTFAELHQLRNFTVNVYSDKSEEDGIIKFADEVNGNLIALATHGHAGLLHLITGSVSEDVVEHSTRPVMTFLVEH